MFACGEQGHIAPECKAPRNKSRKRNDWNKKTKNPKESFYFDKQEIDGWNAEDEFDNLVEFDQHTEHSHDQRHQRDNDRQSVHSKYLETASSTKPFFDTLFRHRFILPFGIDLLPLGTINTTNTNSNLDDAIHCPLEIENFECKSSNGLYSGFIDTGSNTPAMNKAYSLSEGFPLYHLHRSFNANTANGEIEISEATVVRLSCTNPDGSKYWLQQIFYLLESLPVNILIGRRLMRLLGYDCKLLTQSKFEHTATTSDLLDDEAEHYWQKLWDVTDLNEDTVVNVEPLDSNHTIGSTYDAPGSTAGGQASEHGDHRTAEGNALEIATKRSLFERSMATTADSTALDSTTTSEPSHAAAHTFEGSKNGGTEVQSDRGQVTTTSSLRKPGQPKTLKKVRWADQNYSAEDGHTFDGDDHTIDGEESYDMSTSNPFESALKNVRTDEFDSKRSQKQSDQTPSKSVVSVIEHNHRIILNCESQLTSYDTYCGFKELFVSGPNSDIYHRSAPYRIAPDSLPTAPLDASCLLPFEVKPTKIRCKELFEQRTFQREIFNDRLRAIYTPSTLFIDFTVQHRQQVADHIRRATEIPHRINLRHNSAVHQDIYREFKRNICVVENALNPPQPPLAIPRLKLVSKAVEKRFVALLTEYHHCMAQEWADCGLLKDVYLSLNLKPGSRPFKYKPYGVRYTLRDELKSQLVKLLKAGFIVDSSSSIASPVIFVAKKIVGTNKVEWRMCIDFRMLNSMTIPDVYPLPDIQSLHRRFANKKWFSSIDLRHAYHHIAIRPEDRWKTAFITEHGLFEWTRMTFGFVNAPAAFQRAMNQIFQDLDYVIVYLDDILILSDNEDDHINHLETVFYRLSVNNLKIRQDKCKFFVASLKYLGFILSADGVRPDPEYLARMIAMPRPTDRKSVQRAIGMVQWLHRYIPRLSDYTWPLTALTKKGAKFVWDKRCEMAWDRIKELVENANFLRHPDMQKDFYVACDASSYGIGACLMQCHDGILHPVEFWSRLFKESECHWHVSEKEMSAIVLTLEKWRRYLLGRKFTVYTDHLNLQTLHDKIMSNGTLAKKLVRWWIRIEEFHFDCIHIAGLRNVAADYFSRDVVMEKVERDHGLVNDSNNSSNTNSNTTSTKPSNHRSNKTPKTNKSRSIANRSPDFQHAVLMRSNAMFINSDFPVEQKPNYHQTLHSNQVFIDYRRFGQQHHQNTIHPSTLNGTSSC